MSALDTDRFRERLQEERRRVQAAIQNLHDENPGSIEDETGDQPSDNHLAETATVTFDAALERIEGGTFGTCEKCGKPIGDERLEALPYATQCIDCKRKEE